MKSIKDYIIESAEDGKNGSYQEFVDADTGEIVKIWIDNPDPEEEARKAEQAKADTEAYWKKVELEKELRKKVDPIEDEYYATKDELKNLKQQYRDLQIDHEEEVGALYTNGKYKEGEKLSQKYGAQFNKLDKQIEKLEKKIAKLYDKKEKIWNQILEIW